MLSDLPNLPQQVSERAGFRCMYSGARVPAFSHPAMQSLVSIMYIKHVWETLPRCLDFLKTPIRWKERLYNASELASWSCSPSPSGSIMGSSASGSFFKLRGGLLEFLQFIKTIFLWKTPTLSWHSVTTLIMFKLGFIGAALGAAGEAKIIISKTYWALCARQVLCSAFHMSYFF